MFHVFVAPHEADWEHFLQMWTELWRFDSCTKKTAKTYSHSCNFELPHRFDGPTVMAHQKIRHLGHSCATITVDTQGNESPTQSPNKMFRTLVNRGEKGEVDKHQTFINGHSKGRLRSWCGRIREELTHQCAIPSTTSITRTDTFGKAENQAKRERRSAGKAAQPISYRTADTQRTRARTEDSKGQHHAGKITSTPIFFVVVRMGVVVDEFLLV